jgi:hypothetical protein
LAKIGRREKGDGRRETGEVRGETGEGRRETAALMALVKIIAGKGPISHFRLLHRIWSGKALYI